MNVTPFDPKKFKPSQFERYDLQAQIFETVAQVAAQQGIISQELLSKFGNIRTVPDPNESDAHKAAREKAEKEVGGSQKYGDNNLLAIAIKFRAAKTVPQQKQFFAELKKSIHFDEKELHQLADLMSLLVPAMNAANAVKEWQRPNNDPEEIFRNYFMAGLRTVKDGKNAFGMNPQEWLGHAVATKDKMILALVNTCHPTNFYSDFGRKYQEGIYNAVYKEDMPDGVMREKDLESLAVVVRNACKDMLGKEKKHITFLRQVTVGEEAGMEKEVLEAETKAKNEVLSAWNRAVTWLVEAGAESERRAAKGAERQGFPKLPGEKIAIGFAVASQDIEKLRLTDEDKKRVYQSRSWNWATADKDGRDQATDISLYRGYRTMRNDKLGGIYEGPILDFRENSEERSKTIGALIAAKYQREPAFQALCNRFNENVNLRKQFGGEKQLCDNNLHARPDFDNTHLTFQILTEKNQKAFLLYLMDEGVNLFKQELVKNETLEFNKKYYDTLNSLLDKYNGAAGFKPETPPLNQHTPFGELIKYPRTDGGEGTLLDLLLSDMIGQGFIISRIHAQQGGVSPDKQPIMGFTYYKQDQQSPAIRKQFIKNKNFDPEKPINEKNYPTEKLDDIGSLSCMSYLRRLFVVGDMIEEQKKHGVTVITAEETANFEQPSHFFGQLYLFQQAGLLQLGKDDDSNTIVVGKPKVGLMPLLETTADIKRGEQILREILSTPLGLSYYKERGCAELFIGYSDGSKSGGNFAAHFFIRKFKQTVVKLFEEFKDQGKLPADFEVIVKHGTGRGENRGGTRRYDRQYRMHHDESNASAFNYQTVQGDHIVRMQTDERYCQRTMAEMYVSTMAGAIEAKRVKGDFEIRRNESFERAMEYLANYSEEKYQENVFNKKIEAETFLNTVPKNKNASSRSAVRPGTAQKGIGPQRAIPVEMAAFMSCLPFHDYGLKDALEAYINDPAAPAVLYKDRDGHEHEARGKEALVIMAKDCDFFREEMKLAALRQQSFNPTIADIWQEKTVAAAKELGAKSADITPKRQMAFFTEIMRSLTGLGDLAQSLLAGKTAKAPTREDASGEPYMNAMADIAQSIYAANDTIEPRLSNKIYFTTMGPGTEKPSSHMESQYVPGLSDSHAQLSQTASARM